MLATLLLVLGLLAPVPGPLLAAPLPLTPSTGGLPSPPVGPAFAPTDVSDHWVFLPFISRQPAVCGPIPGVTYGTLDVEGPPPDRPAGQHPDLNLVLRGYELTDAYPGLIDHDVIPDAKAPQLHTLFADDRVPAFPNAYQVYDWDWDCDCRGDLLTDFEVTLSGMGTAPAEVLYLPDSGYDIGSGYEALVLYATEERITLKYTREDHVVYGYTIHVENVCVEPSLLALYQEWNGAGRAELPALRAGQPFGRARGQEIGVGIRDTGRFMDPRWRPDWWRAK